MILDSIQLPEHLTPEWGAGSLKSETEPTKLVADRLKAAFGLFVTCTSKPVPCSRSRFIFSSRTKILLSVGSDARKVFACNRLLKSATGARKRVLANSATGTTVGWKVDATMHTEDDSFSLPYWNYHQASNRRFPREFGIQHLDGNMENEAEENINPLYLALR